VAYILQAAARRACACRGAAFALVRNARRFPSLCRPIAAPIGRRVCTNCRLPLWPKTTGPING